MPICNSCQHEFPNKVVIDNKHHNLQNRKYCLNCSPFGKHNTCQLHIDSESKKCPNCKKEKPLDQFYKRRKGKDPSVYCKICTNIQATNRQREFKQKCVSYKGGKCEECGYDKTNVALDFHHINPLTKDFTISKIKSWKFDKKITDELDKCKLLCKNCHAEIHEKIYEEKWCPWQGSNLQP